MKRTKRGAGLFWPNKCGVLNPSKTYKDNSRNCLKHKDKWATDGVKLKGMFPIQCNRSQVQDYNFPSNPTCVNDIIDREFDPTTEDDITDGNMGLMY